MTSCGRTHFPFLSLRRRPPTHPSRKRASSVVELPKVTHVAITLIVSTAAKRMHTSPPKDVRPLERKTSKRTPFMLVLRQRCYVTSDVTAEALTGNEEDIYMPAKGFPTIKCMLEPNRAPVPPRQDYLHLSSLL